MKQNELYASGGDRASGGLSRRDQWHAVTAGYLTSQPGDDGHAASIQLTPDVAFSLGLSANPPAPDSAAITTRAIDSWCLPAAS